MSPEYHATSRRVLTTMPDANLSSNAGDSAGPGRHAPLRCVLDSCRCLMECRRRRWALACGGDGARADAGRGVHLHSGGERGGAGAPPRAPQHRGARQAGRAAAPGASPGAGAKAWCLLLIHAEASLSHGGLGDSLVPPYTRRIVALSVSRIASTAAPKTCPSSVSPWMPQNHR